MGRLYDIARELQACVVLNEESRCAWWSDYMPYEAGGDERSVDADIGARIEQAAKADEARMMPEGLEWPCFEDGEPVRFGDAFEVGGECGVVTRVAFGTDGDFAVVGRANDPRHFAANSGPRVKRPDVLGADGRPIRVGETVYTVETGQEYRVEHVHPEYVRLYKSERGMADEWARATLGPDRLTHEPPDSWERIEADCMLLAGEYCERRGIALGHNPRRAQAADIVRRARALAERGTQ